MTTRDAILTLLAEIQEFIVEAGGSDPPRLKSVLARSRVIVIASADKYVEMKMSEFDDWARKLFNANKHAAWGIDAVRGFAIGCLWAVRDRVRRSNRSITGTKRQKPGTRKLNAP